MNLYYDALLTLRGISEYYAFLRKSQYASPNEIRARQAEWLTRLLVHAHANVPWYSSRFRQYGVRLKGSDPFAELAKMPVLTKTEIRENHADFCVSGVAAKSLSFATSGTTGEPLVADTNPHQMRVEKHLIYRPR